MVVPNSKLKNIFKAAKFCCLSVCVVFVCACSERMKNPKKDVSFEVVELYEDSAKEEKISNETSAKKESADSLVESKANDLQASSQSSNVAEKSIESLFQNFDVQDVKQQGEQNSYHRYIAYYRSEKFVPNKISLIEATGGKITWPTESKEFDLGKSYEDFIQGTFGNPPASGLFGDVRNSGYRFHEGIDVKSVRRDKKGEALDDVRAAMKGKVVMINKVAGNSSYGRYVVLSHDDLDVPVYTLYAHLKEVDPWIAVSKKVEVGQKLGTMGRSATYPIAKECAHLHFEVGLMYSSHFEKWYTSKKYTTKNFFGNYNGMNLMGLDPLDFFYNAKSGKLNQGLASFIKNLDTAFVLRYYTKKTPDFVNLYPNLVDLKGSKVGWDIHFTWWGLPHKITRIENPSSKSKDGDIEIIGYDKNCIGHRCTKFVSIDKKGKARPTEKLMEILKKMF